MSDACDILWANDDILSNAQQHCVVVKRRICNRRTSFYFNIFYLQQQNSWASSYLVPSYSRNHGDLVSCICRPVSVFCLLSTANRINLCSALCTEARKSGVILAKHRHAWLRVLSSWLHSNVHAYFAMTVKLLMDGINSFSSLATECSIEAKPAQKRFSHPPM